MMPLTLRQLEWMANARRRDEWDRFSRLLALVEVGTNWSGEPLRKRPIDYWPKELIPAEFTSVEPSTWRPTASPAAYDRLKALARK